MLTDSQREGLARLLRASRQPGASAGGVTRRDPGLAELPASFGQEQLWFLDRLAPGQAAYTIPVALALTGPLDVAALQRALGALLARHEALRTRLVPGPDGAPRQVIGPPPSAIALELTDLAGTEPGKRRDRLAQLIRAAAMRPFDLAGELLLRAWLARLDAAEHMLVLVVHHVVFDGWSARVLAGDLAALYRAEVTGEPSGLADLPVQFADYALWQRQLLAGPRLAALQEYWRGALAGAPAVAFPADRPRPLVDDFAGALAERISGPAVLAALRELSRREGVTLFTTLLAALLTLLHRYTGQDDLTVGTVTAGRDRSELEPLIGFFASMLPVRCDLSADPSFRELMLRVKGGVLGSFSHQELPLAKIAEAAGVPPDPSRSPVFQIALTFAESDGAAEQAAGLSIAASDIVVGTDAAKFDLTFTVQARPGGLWTECSYKTALFDAGTIERLLDHWEVLLRGVAAGPSARLSELPLLTPAELHAETTRWNDPSPPAPAACAHEMFLAQADATPGAVAARCGGQQVTYAELRDRAQAVARQLRRLGIGPEPGAAAGTLAGVCMQPGADRLAAVLGIWLAGGGYVPLDPALPAARLSFVIADAGLQVILTDPASRASLPAGCGAVIAGCGPAAGGAAADESAAGGGASPAGVAYVIYTSGSTGQPKGVVVEHRNLTAIVTGLAGQWGIGRGSVVLNFSSFAFDASVLDMFLPLLSGGTVVMAPADTLHSPQRLAELLRRERVTYVLLPPAVLDLLPDGPYPDLRVLVAGGEELPPGLARRWCRPGLRLINAYGPTEATVVATFADLAGWTAAPPPIGRPACPGVRVYVLDRWRRPVPAGVTGEVYVGGAGVARGYLNRPELTAERFIADPLQAGGRLYQTGDLARRRADGQIVFCGRADAQVKIHGVRIEPGEVEAALAEHPGVAQAVVTVLAGPAGEQQLAGYLRPVSGAAPPGEQELRGWLGRRLPAVMVPARFVTVAAFPLSSSGKVDRAALPPPGPAAGDRAEPGTLIEALLASSYAAVLGQAEVGATDSFFDLGGTSLAAMRLVSELNTELAVDLGVTAVFLAPTPRELAAVLREEHGLPDEPLATAGL